MDTAATLSVNQEYKKAVADGAFGGTFKEFMQKLFGDEKTTATQQPMSTTTKVMIGLAIAAAGYLIIKN